MKTKQFFTFLIIIISISILKNCYSYGNESKFNLQNYDISKQNNISSVSFGEFFGGGLVFYINPSGIVYVCAPSDQSTSTRWCYTFNFLGASTLTGIGTGFSNTNIIVSEQGTGSGTDYAAYLCDQLVLNGHNDWFLPSKDELNLMYVNLKIAGLGSFVNDFYWSSSNFPSSFQRTAWTQNFSDGTQTVVGKTVSFLHTRAVRSFLPLTLNLTMFMQGFYNASAHSMIQDTAKVYLHNTIQPYDVVDSVKAFMSSSGTGTFLFANAVNGVNYFIQLNHRNSLETWSAVGQSFTGSVMNYDFSNSSSQAFGNNVIQIDASPTRYGIYSGDVNQDGSVDLTDVLRINSDANDYKTGYIVTDVNGDLEADLTDVLVAYNNSVNFVSVKKP